MPAEVIHLPVIFPLPLFPVERRGTVKVISEHLGHRDTRTTETIYAHVFAETMVQASDAISNALAKVDV